MNSSQTGVILEEIRDQNHKILEGLGILLPLAREIPAVKMDIAEMKVGIKAIKSALRDTNRDVKDHGRRITALETRA